MHENVSLLAYSPLAQGYLTGKYLDGARPPGARTTLFSRGQRYENPTAEAAIRKYIALARIYCPWGQDLRMRMPDCRNEGRPLRCSTDYTPYQLEINCFGTNHHYACHTAGHKLDGRDVLGIDEIDHSPGNCAEFSAKRH